ncbi:hypothetical protein AVEN_196406-1 [Araneus ventricosus]|uniref:Uncharacterized protein n=1 Tax=Araneus ventricosus TaxID=182803 RepID=A0A4Y2AV44_ARAVE|nr:hypothetical protein AVEN_196406-1 [Araneus ventricosus]
MLGDFTFLNIIISHIRREEIGLPAMYRPPKTSWVHKDGQKIDGGDFNFIGSIKLFNVFGPMDVWGHVHEAAYQLPHDAILQLPLGYIGSPSVNEGCSTSETRL